MKKFFSLTLTLAAMLSAMAVSAQATDYSFETDEVGGQAVLGRQH